MTPVRLALFLTACGALYVAAWCKWGMEVSR